MKLKLPENTAAAAAVITGISMTAITIVATLSYFFGPTPFIVALLTVGIYSGVYNHLEFEKKWGNKGDYRR